MSTAGSIINVIFEPAPGISDRQTMEAVTGKTFPTLPAARRKGWIFTGWYTAESGGEKICSGDPVTQEEDIRLYAHWRRPDRQTGSTPARKSLPRMQRIAIFAVLGIVIVLAVAIPLIIKYVVNVYKFEDSDGTLYYIRSDAGEYALYTADGQKLAKHVYVPDEDENTVYHVSGQASTTYYITASGNQVAVDPDTGKNYLFAVVDTDEGEVVGQSTRIMMFAQIEQTNIHRIEVHNTEGTFAVYTVRLPSSSNAVYFEGYETNTNIAFDPEKYAGLCVGSGYTLSRLRLDRAVVQEHGYEEYGFNVLYSEDGSITAVNSENYVIVTERKLDSRTGTYLSGEAGISHTVFIGDPIPTGAGYYAKLEGRDTVYILNATLVEYLLKPMNYFLDPVVIYPLSTSNYYDMTDFQIYEMDYSVSDETGNDEDIIANCKVSFSYIPMEARERTMVLNEAFRFTKPFSYKFGDYVISADKAALALGTLQVMKATEVVVVDPDEADLIQYKLDKPKFWMHYTYNNTDSFGNTTPIDTDLMFSANMGGFYYCYSYFSNCILTITEEQLRYLEFDSTDWLDQGYYSSNIAFVDEFDLRTAEGTYHFTPDNSWSMHFQYTAAEDVYQAPDYASVETSADGSYTVTYYCYYLVQTGGAYEMHAYSILVRMNADDEVTGYKSNNDDHVVFKDNELTAYINSLARSRYECLNYLQRTGKKVTETAMTAADLSENVQVFFDINGSMFGYDTRDGKMYEIAYQLSSENLQVAYEYNGQTGLIQDSTLVKNFRYLYQEVLLNTLEEPDLTEEEQAAINALDDSEFLLVLTVKLSDNASVVNSFCDEDNSRTLVVRFYQYSERRCYVSVNGEGEFFVLTPTVKKIIADAARVIAGETVDIDAKY
ncbi:MAG: DUF4340 domain-containing protein [Clostridia bacterium]|nr:DUF4340 domain-containing protein [Clostridia bacterium]